MKEGILRKSALFNGLTETEVEAVLARLPHDVRQYRRGEFLLHSGEETRRFGILMQGDAMIFQDDFWGNRNILARLIPGELFAESYACMPGSILRVSVCAENDCKILWLGMRELLDFTTDPRGARLMRNLVAVLAEKNLTMNEKITHVTQRSIREKLLSFLSAECLRQGNTCFEIRLNRQQLADYLAVDRSALSAELSRMRREGILSYRKNRFELYRPNRT